MRTDSGKYQTRDDRQARCNRVPGAKAYQLHTGRGIQSEILVSHYYDVPELFPFADGCDGSSPFLNPPGERAAVSLGSWALCPISASKSMLEICQRMFCKLQNGQRANLISSWRACCLDSIVDSWLW